MRSEAAREQLFSRRALFIGGLQAAAGLLLGGRMVYLSVFEGEKYTLLAEDNRVSVRLIPPRRGWIVDRNGQPLAINQPEYRLELVPEQIEDIDRTLAQLGEYLQLELDEVRRIRTAVETQPGYLPIEIASGIDWQEYTAINVRLPEFEGVQPVRGFKRYYPDGAAVGHLLGYVGAPTREQYLEADRDPLLLHPAFKVGKDGLEKMLDEPLRGETGARRVEVNARGRIVRELSTRADTPGGTVRLTIDRDLQAYSARRIGPASASVVVMEVETGNILAMVSMPAFNPNDFSDGISHAEWNGLMADERLPLINKTVQGLYPPGSTFKPITALAALANGVEPEAPVYCPGSYRLGSHRFACWKRGGHGRVDLARGIFQSCNVYFYSQGHRIGIQPIADMARKFGLGEEFARLQVPTQREGIVPDPAWKMGRYEQEWLAGETLNASIGQGYTVVSPLQLAVMVARLASGRAVQPTLLHRNNIGLPEIDVDPVHLAIVRAAMDQTVNGPGTAGRARLPLDNVRMGGKTGTAQVRRISAAERARGVLSNDQLAYKLRDHGLFVGFAPADYPRYAISVIVEHGGGSAAALPIARDVMTFLYDKDKSMKSLKALEEEWDIVPVAADLVQTTPPETSPDAQQFASRPA